ncbi:hypothetical protein [Nonomuraea aridisoli]|uniref:Uncharacterized protein n=1 Tax=Nonomuraea aridisoli TaxID=2070368 RepID=A0A2W2DSB5_9ACTN|nr:hypothetical protein [Nonomuraea aridisoli]PZG13121.1 hypothetical protein C1J01_30925 [Nonomuraea aridisoli]
MSKHEKAAARKAAGRRVERGSAEEATRTPLTPTEAEASRRPAGVTPGATPGFEEGDDADGRSRYDEDPCIRIKELNPDDFE